MTKFQRRLRELGFISYTEYLQSDHWQSTRTRYRRSRLPKKCYICGEPRYQLHHRSYKRLGSERLTDLLPLCDDCHKDTHGLLKRRPRVGLWKAAKALKRERTGPPKRATART